MKKPKKELTLNERRALLFEEMEMKVAKRVLKTVTKHSKAFPSPLPVPPKINFEKFKAKHKD